MMQPSMNIMTARPRIRRRSSDTPGRGQRLILLEGLAVPGSHVVDHVAHTSLLGDGVAADRERNEDGRDEDAHNVSPLACDRGFATLFGFQCIQSRSLASARLSFPGLATRACRKLSDRFHKFRRI